jgi:hypothetical protein
MDKLQKFIDEHRSEFENEHLPEGHRERFEHKLKERKEQKRATLYSYILGAAASVALLFYVANTYLLKSATEQQYPYSCNGKDARDLCHKYNMQMNDIQRQIETIYKKNKNTGTTEMIAESQWILEQSRLFEAQVVPSLSCSSAGLHSISRYYNGNLQSLAFMLSQIERNDYINN